MDKDRYEVVINGVEGILDVSEEPFCTFGGAHFPIRRRMTKNSSWGYIDFDYSVVCPDGEIVSGSVSPRDGIGVSVEGERGWGIRNIEEAAYRLSDHTEIVIDQEARSITVDSTEPAERLAHIICGVVLLADPQDQWEKGYAG